MLKLLLITLLLGLAAGSSASAQRPYARMLPGLPLDSVSNQISFRGVVAVPGVGRAEVYGRAQEWIARHFEQYLAVVQLAAPERGVLIGRAVTQAQAPAVKGADARRFDLLFLFCLRAEEGRIRYEFTDFSFPRYAVTSVVGDASSGQLADALVGWLRRNDFSAIGTAASQTHRTPAETELRDYDLYTSQGAPKPRLVQQCQGIQEAASSLLASLTQALTRPRR